MTLNFLDGAAISLSNSITNFLKNNSLVFHTESSLYICNKAKISGGSISLKLSLEILSENNFASLNKNKFILN